MRLDASGALDAFPLGLPLARAFDQIKSLLARKLFLSVFVSFRRRLAVIGIRRRRG